MLNEKIDKLIGELEEGQETLSPFVEINNCLGIAITKLLSDICKELIEIKQDIETEKAIDNCRLRILEMMDEGVGDCGVDENGRCIGYSYDGGACEECRTCAYSAIEEEV